MSSFSRGRGNYPQRGRGRGSSHGYTTGSNRASSSSNSNTMPIPGDPLYEEFQQFLKTKESNTPSYSKMVTDNNDGDFEYKRSSHTDEIIILETNDVMLYFENGDNPWFLMTRYLENASYAACSYKNRVYYENILKATESVEIQHFFNFNTPNIYNFSKAIIKKLITPNEWGLNTLREKEFSLPDSKTIYKCTYWDYIDSFYKAFLYENPKRTHTWFFKVCGNIYVNNKEIPNWFKKWWISHGPSIDILPDEPFRKLYGEWLPNSSRYNHEITHNNASDLDVISTRHFFMEFSIPWIWKWEPIADYTPNKFPTLQRAYSSRFWPKMLLIDPATKRLESQDTIDNINKKIKEYREQKEFAQRNNPIRLNQDADKLSRDDMIRAYLAQMKEEIKKFKEDDNASMTSANSQNSFQILAGESQPEDDNDIPIECMFEIIEEQLLQKKSKGKDAP